MKETVWLRVVMMTPSTTTMYIFLFIIQFLLGSKAEAIVVLLLSYVLTIKMLHADVLIAVLQSSLTSYPLYDHNFSYHVVTSKYGS